MVGKNQDDYRAEVNDDQELVLFWRNDRSNNSLIALLYQYFANYNF